MKIAYNQRENTKMKTRKFLFKTRRNMFMQCTLEITLIVINVRTHPIHGEWETNIRHVYDI